ncbi:MAG: hypothetical protein AAF378_17910, partial [Cyanobacteria bacterium P01_A01_bin.84]
YENMFAAADELAERMRALGRLAPTTISTLSDHSEVSELSKLVSGFSQSSLPVQAKNFIFGEFSCFLSLYMSKIRHLNI